MTSDNMYDMRKIMLLTSAFVCCMSLFFVSCNTPKKSGKQLATRENRICKEYQNELDELNWEFSVNLDVRKYSTRQAAKDEWLSRHTDISSKLDKDLLDIHTEVERIAAKLAYKKRHSFLDSYREHLDASMQDELLRTLTNDDYPIDVQRAVARIIPPKPDETQMKEDLVKRTLNDVEGGYFYEANRIINIDEYNIEDFNMIEVEKESSMDYSVKVSFVLSGKVNNDRRISVICEIRYVLPEYDDWAIGFILTKELSIVKCDSYTECVKLQAKGGWLIQDLYVKNVCDKSLEVFVRYNEYGRWKKTIVTAKPQDDTPVTNGVPNERQIEYVLPL